MSQRRKLRRSAVPAGRPVDAFWRGVLTLAEMEAMPAPGEPVCGAKPPELAGSHVPVSCPFKAGHAVRCRYFSAIEGA